MSVNQKHEVDGMTALDAADALVGLARAGASEATGTSTIRFSRQEEQVASPVPLFTDEEERREKQQLSPHEILEIESDLRGITIDMDNMSIEGGDVTGGSSCVEAAPADRDGQGVGPSGPDVKQQPLSWRNQDEIQRDLNLLNEELEQLPASGKAAYLTAMQRCPAEAFGGWRWDAFLEQRDFDVKRTAKKLVEYWEMRLAAFGEGRCYLPMTLAGAMRDEVAEMIKYCHIGISPVKDASGRTVMIVTLRKRVRSLYSTICLCRAWWYELEVIAQDPEARRCGVVLIFDGSNVKPNQFDPRFGKFVFSSFELFPVSWKATHFVNTSMGMASRFFLPAFRFIMGRRLRHRLIVHTGTISDTIDEMRTYALPPERLPKEYGGEVVIDMQQWIYGRYAKEVLNMARPGPNIEQNVDPSINADVLHSAGSNYPLPTAIESTLSPVASSLMQASDGPSTKRLRSENGQEISTAPIPLATARTAPNRKKQSGMGRGRGNGRGKKTDPRMARAIELKQANPDLPLYDALVAGGFVFRQDDMSNEMVDTDGITLAQRKNNLCRRLRLERQKEAKEPVTPA